jgi:putative acyl-CoA dehydrogenase
VTGSTAAMRAGVAAATWHAAHRSAFGARLADQPLMRNVLADLAVESEAATVLAIRLAAAYDATAARDGADPHEVAFARLATAVGKYWACKRHPGLSVEALECLGGNGYVEESILPRLFRESPLNGIWEGSGNVICLDVLRAMGREPAALDAFREEVLAASGADARFDAHCRRLDAVLSDASDLEARARQIVEAMALALQASLLIRSGSQAMADAFCASRLDPDARSAVFGTLPSGVDVGAIIERAQPKVAA